MTDRKPWASSRESSEKRGYGRRHRELRAQLFAREPLCRHCKAKGRVKIATVADHILSIAKGGAIHDITNLQPLCERCHSRKSLLEQGKRPRPTFGIDGWPNDD
jgi:5-methylcytosine-specific restriction protein A